MKVWNGYNGFDYRLYLLVLLQDEAVMYGWLLECLRNDHEYHIHKMKIFH